MLSEFITFKVLVIPTISMSLCSLLHSWQNSCEIMNSFIIFPFTDTVAPFYNVLSKMRWEQNLQTRNQMRSLIKCKERFTEGLSISLTQRFFPTIRVFQALVPRGSIWTHVPDRSRMQKRLWIINIFKWKCYSNMTDYTYADQPRTSGKGGAFFLQPMKINLH